MSPRPVFCIAVAFAVAGCDKVSEPPARAGEGYYRCVYRGHHPDPTLDFVIGPGDSVITFNTERGVFRPGTYTYEHGLLTLEFSSETRRLRAEADRGDHSGPFRLIEPNGRPQPFLCTWAEAESPVLTGISKTAAAR